MLKEGIPIGRIFGINIRLHYSWFLIFAVVTWALATNYFPVVYPEWSTTTAVITGLITSLLFFISLLAHELMHSIVAQRSGIPVKSITLFVFGGVSQITREPDQAGMEFKIAIAGPLTSVVLGVIFWAIWFLVPARFETVSAVSFWLGWINLSLAAFNLVPGFPLDGGRVLRAIIWWRTKDLRRATRLASNFGRLIGFILIGAGIWFIFTGYWFNGLWLALIGWFLFNSATQSYRQLVLQQSLQGYSASDIMHHDCSMIAPTTTIEKLVNEFMLPQGRRCFLVTEGGKMQGLVTLQEIKKVQRDAWATTEVSKIMQPVDQLAWVKPEEDLNTVMTMLTEKDINQIPVMEKGEVVGMVARDNLLNFINVRSSLGMTEGDTPADKG
jgi:Zn-dependent protease/CBS domain-containing protein